MLQNKNDTRQQRHFDRNVFADKVPDSSTDAKQNSIRRGPGVSAQRPAIWGSKEIVVRPRQRMDYRSMDESVGVAGNKTSMDDSVLPAVQRSDRKNTQGLECSTRHVVQNP